MLGAMQHNGLPKLFHRSDFIKDSVSMMLEKIPPTRDHEGDFKISLFALNGYFLCQLTIRKFPSLIHSQHVAEAEDGLHKKTSRFHEIGS